MGIIFILFFLRLGFCYDTIFYYDQSAGRAYLLCFCYFMPGIGLIVCFFVDRVVFRVIALLAIHQLRILTSY